MNTKERILYEALRLFSTKDYDSVSVRDIAKEVGIKESSLYNHFKNKQDIFDNIIEICETKASEHFSKMNIPFDINSDVSIYKNISNEMLIDIVINTFTYFFEDEYAKLFRKLVIINQFSNKALRSLYISSYRDMPIRFQAGIFKMLIQSGEFISVDENLIAFEFYSPIFVLLHTVESIEEAKPFIINHINQFVKTYKNKT